MMPGYPRQCYFPMPPMPGMPILPEGVYPLDYDDLSTLSGTFLVIQVGYCNSSIYIKTFLDERANLIMASFNLNGPNNENTTASIIEKVVMIAAFMGVWMKDEYYEAYDKQRVVKEIKKMAASKSGKFRSNYPLQQ
jgi:hypothetical protein